MKPNLLLFLTIVVLVMVAFLGISLAQIQVASAMPQPQVAFAQSTPNAELTPEATAEVSSESGIQVLDMTLLHDTSLLTGDPCAAPCWQNITPGETTWREGVAMIEDNERFTDIELLNDAESDARAATWHYDDGKTCCQMFSRYGDVVDTIFVLLAPDMTTGEILEVYGEPTYVTGEEVTDDQALLALIFPDYSLVVYSFVAGAVEGMLTADSEVVGAIYMTEIDMEQVIASTNLYYWVGYQSYADYITGEFDVTPIPADDE